MRKNAVVATDFAAQFANSFHKRQAFNVTNGATNLDDVHIAALTGFDDRALDGVRKVRHHLDGLALEFPSAFFFN